MIWVIYIVTVKLACELNMGPEQIYILLVYIYLHSSVLSPLPLSEPASTKVVFIDSNVWLYLCLNSAYSMSVFSKFYEKNHYYFFILEFRQWGVILKREKNENTSTWPNLNERV